MVMNLVFLENWTFCCPVLGSRLCTRAYAEIVDPACLPSIPLLWYWHGTVRQGSIRFNTERRRASYLPVTILLYIIYLWYICYAEAACSFPRLNKLVFYIVWILISAAHILWRRHRFCLGFGSQHRPVDQLGTRHCGRQLLWRQIPLNHSKIKK